MLKKDHMEVASFWVPETVVPLKAVRTKEGDKCSM